MTCHGLSNPYGDLFESVSCHRISCIGKGQIIHRLRRDEMDVAVGNFKSGDDESDSFTTERILKTLRYFMSSRKKMVGELRGKIRPFVDFLDGTQQNVPVGNWVDSQEAGTEFIAVHKRSRNVSSKDACENRGHLQNLRPRYSGCVGTLVV